jgi:DNA-binding IclR family transcriptional regulator
MDDTSMAVKSADRALVILEYLAAGRVPRSPTEIAENLRIPRSSLHGLLRTLQSRGWVTMEEGDFGLRYRIGPQALTVGGAYLLSDEIVRRSAAVMDGLSLDLGETIHLGELQGSEVLYLAKRDARHNLRLMTGVGVRVPAFETGLGKMLLSDLDQRALEALFSGPRSPMTAKSLVSNADLFADLVATEARGYAIDDEESTEGVRCFAFALGGARPRRYAISCSVPTARLDAEFESRVLACLSAAARALSIPESMRTVGV